MGSCCIPDCALFCIDLCVVKEAKAAAPNSQREMSRRRRREEGEKERGRGGCDNGQEKERRETEKRVLCIRI